MLPEGPEAVASLLGDVSRETSAGLSRYAEALLRWNRRINLIAPGDAAALWSRHIADCAQLVSLAPTNATWIDIGAGAGLPGLVVAILLRDFGGGHVHLVEPNRKKAAFLLAAIAETGAAATVHACRIEELHGKWPEARVVTARAVAPLAELLRLARPWLTGRAIGLFQKGRDYRREVEQCRDEWTFALLEHPSRTDSSAVILEISGLRRKEGAVSP